MSKLSFELAIPVMLFAVGLAGISGFLSSLSQREAWRQARTAQEQVWEERIAAAATPEEKHILKAIRQEASGSCHPSYTKDLLETKKKSDPEVTRAFLVRQENHCIQAMMGRAHIQQDPFLALPILERLLQDPGA